MLFRLSVGTTQLCRRARLGSAGIRKGSQRPDPITAILRNFEFSSRPSISIVAQFARAVGLFVVNIQLSSRYLASGCRRTGAWCGSGQEQKELMDRVLSRTGRRRTIIWYMQCGDQLDQDVEAGCGATLCDVFRVRDRPL